MSHAENSDVCPNVLLIGAGVVGRAIAQAHIDRGIDCYLADQNDVAIEQTAASLGRPFAVTSDCGIDLPTIHICSSTGQRNTKANRSGWFVIESIAEKLEVKRELFRNLAARLGDNAILCTNTSTIRISEIAESVPKSNRFCGMHFFMPVDQRRGVEIIGHETTDPLTIDAVQSHAERLAKQPFLAADTPGFLVNRMLSPYLNQALLLLTTGADAKQIEMAALQFGMPISPLELIDWIGAPTMFHAGRVYWQAYPQRLDPSPLLAGLVKRKRHGRLDGEGLYRYDGENRSTDLAEETQSLIEKYRTDQRDYSDEDIAQLLSIPMWIETQLAVQDGAAQTVEQIETAMQAGLGFQNPKGWEGYFRSLGQKTIDGAVDKWQDIFRSMRM